MSQKCALITGITGQDGSYMAQLLLRRGYRVVGAHRSGGSDFWRLQALGIRNEMEFVEIDLLNAEQVRQTLIATQPTEVYNFAAQSYVAQSFEQPLHACEVDALGAARILEAIRTVSPKTKFCQASTSEMFDRDCPIPHNEKTLVRPRNPYATAKLFAHCLTANYRECFGLFTCSAILFNHESPLRGEKFVTKKITSGLARMANGATAPVILGNIDATRDWGYAGDYVQGMWQMLQQSEPDDYVLATGHQHSVRRFAECAASLCGFELVWQKDQRGECAIDRLTGRCLVTLDPDPLRATVLDARLGDPAKAFKQLGWKADVQFDQLVAMMTEWDLAACSQDLPVSATSLHSHD